MVPLAQALRDIGEVLWAVSPEFIPVLEQAGFAAEPAGIAFGNGPPGNGPPGNGPPPFDPAELMALPERERSTLIFSRVFGGALVPPMLADLQGVVERFKPTLIVHEAAELAAPIAGAAAGIATVTHSLGPIMPAERIAALGGLVEGLWEEVGLEPRPYAGCYEHLYLDICPPSLQRGEMGHVPSVLHMRPVPFSGAGEGLPDWPDSSSRYPLVYVTFGTTLAARAAPLDTIVQALRELPVRLLITLGSQGDPASLGPQPGNVHVARFIPQTDVLPQCAAVVSHAGAGTMLAALANGLPQVCVPLAADQFDNAEICARAGAAIVLTGEQVSVETVREAALALLSDGPPRAAAEKLAAEIAAMPSPAETARAMLELLAA
jgi:UDP-N-acetylglucosamine transferase subunit ALG13